MLISVPLFFRSCNYISIIYKRFLANDSGKVCFLLQIYNISNTAARKTTPTLGFKLKRGKLIQSSKFIGWKSSQHKRASSLQGRSCPVGLTLSYLLLNASLYPVNSSVSTAFREIYYDFNEYVYMFARSIIFETYNFN